jgi:hypothetical protein
MVKRMQGCGTLQKYLAAWDKAILAFFGWGGACPKFLCRELVAGVTNWRSTVPPCGEKCDKGGPKEIVLLARLRCLALDSTGYPAFRHAEKPPCNAQTCL